MDRLPIFFLAALAVVRRRAWLSLTEIIYWVGKRKEVRWRKPQLGQRLRRLFECRIEVPTVNGWEPFRFVKRYAIDELGDKLYVEFSDEFVRAAQHGVVMPLEHVRALSMHPFALEVYTKLRLILHEGIWTRCWDLRSELRAGARHSFGAQLKEALAMISQVWPKHPFIRVDVVCVACDYDVFRKLVHGTDVDEERRAFAAEIADMNRAQVREYIREQPEWRQTKMYGTYLYDWMYPDAMELVDRTGSVIAETTAAVQGLEAMTAVWREFGERGEVGDGGARAVTAHAVANADGMSEAEDSGDDLTAGDLPGSHTLVDELVAGASDVDDTTRSVDDSSGARLDAEGGIGVKASTADDRRPQSRLRRLGAMAGKAAGRMPGVHTMVGNLASAAQGVQRLSGLVRATGARFTTGHDAANNLGDVHRGRDVPGSMTSDERSNVQSTESRPAGRSRMRRAVASALSATTARGSPLRPWRAIVRWRQKSDGEDDPSDAT